MPFGVSENGSLVSQENLTLTASKMTQKEIILRVCQDKEWHHGWEFMREDTPWGFLGKNGDRRARELAEEELLSTDYDSKGQVRYRITDAGLRHLARVDGIYNLTAQESQMLFR